MKIKVDSSDLEVRNAQVSSSSGGAIERRNNLDINIGNPDKDFSYYKNLFANATTIEIPKPDGQKDTFNIVKDNKNEAIQLNEYYQDNECYLMCHLPVE